MTRILSSIIAAVAATAMVSMSGHPASAAPTLDHPTLTPAAVITPQIVAGAPATQVYNAVASPPVINGKYQPPDQQRPGPDPRAASTYRWAGCGTIC